jgi:hypothetical protein
MAVAKPDKSQYSQQPAAAANNDLSNLPPLPAEDDVSGKVGGARFGVSNYVCQVLSVSQSVFLLLSLSGFCRSIMANIAKGTGLLWTQICKPCARFNCNSMYFIKEIPQSSTETRGICNLQQIEQCTSPSALYSKRCNNVIMACFWEDS